MVEAATRTCARCGAPLPPGSEDADVRCAYCGTYNQLASKERTLRPPFDPSPPQVPAGMVIAGAAFGGIMILASALTAFFRVMPSQTRAPPQDTPRIHDQTTTAPAPSEPAPAPPKASAVLGGMLLLDVDGDGLEDVLGVFEGPEGPSSKQIGALSGVDGHVLWTLREGLVGAADLDKTFRALVDYTLVVVDLDGRAAAINTQNGSSIWSTHFTNAVRTLCYHGSVAEAVGLDEAVFAFSLDSGGPVAMVGGRDCQAAYSSASEGPNFRVVEGDHAAALLGSLRADFVASRALVPRVGAARVLLGSQRSTGAPAVAVVASGKILWQSQVAASTSGPPTEPSLSRAAVRYDHVVVPYLVASPVSLHVTSFDLASGKRQWDVAFAGESWGGGEVAIGLDRRVFLRTEAGRLWVLELADGAAHLLVGAP